MQWITYPEAAEMFLKNSNGEKGGILRA